MLTTPHCKESLSRAYVTAVVGRARHKLNWNSEFDYGVDGYVRMIERRGARHYETGLGFDFQSKTTTKWSLQAEFEYIITMFWEREQGQTVKIRVPLSPHQYIRACDAHKEGRAIRIFGVPEKSGKFWTLTKAHDFTVLNKN